MDCISQFNSADNNLVYVIILVLPVFSLRERWTRLGKMDYPWVRPDYVCNSKTIKSKCSVILVAFNLKAVQECKCNRKSVDPLLHSRKLVPKTIITLLNLIWKAIKSVSVSVKKEINFKNNFRVRVILVRPTGEESRLLDLRRLTVLEGVAEGSLSSSLLHIEGDSWAPKCISCLSSCCFAHSWDQGRNFLRAIFHEEKAELGKPSTLRGPKSRNTGQHALKCFIS